MCDPPRMYPSLPEYTPLFKKCICATLPESTPLSQNMPPFSTTICDPPRIYPSLLEFTLFCNNYNIMRPSQNLPLPPRITLFLFSQFICATRLESTPPSQNIPPFQPIYICDPPCIYPSLPEYTPFFNQFINATLPESTPPSQNIPPFSTNLYVRRARYLPLLLRYLPSTTKFNVYVRLSQNRPLPPRIYPPFQQL